MVVSSSIPKLASSSICELARMRFVTFFTVCFWTVICVLFFAIALWGWAGRCVQTEMGVQITGVPMGRVFAEQSDEHE